MHIVKASAAHFHDSRMPGCNSVKISPAFSSILMWEAAVETGIWIDSAISIMFIFLLFSSCRIFYTDLRG